MVVTRLVLLLTIVIESTLSNEELSKELLGKLNHQGRPALNAKEQLLVHVLGSLYQLVDVDQRNNLATVSAYFDLRWKDLKLTWDPADFNGTEEMYLPSSSVWLPELYLYHSVEGSTPIGIQETAVQVQHHGEVRIFVPFTARALCPINVKYFPFDTQWCNFTFGSWSYKADAIKFIVESDSINEDDFYDNQEWVLLQSRLLSSLSRYKVTGKDSSLPVKSQTEHRDETYSAVIMELQISRQSFYYVFNLMVPTTLVSLTAIIGFHSPSNAMGRRENKFRLGITTLLSMGVMLLMVVDEMPKFALSSQPGQRGSFSDVPLLGLLYLSLICIISLGTCTASFFVLLEAYAAKRLKREQMPSVIRWLDFDFKPLVCWICYKKSAKPWRRKYNEKKEESMVLKDTIEIGTIAIEHDSLMFNSNAIENHKPMDPNRIHQTSSETDAQCEKPRLGSYRLAVSHISRSPTLSTKAKHTDNDELIPQLKEVAKLLHGVSDHLVLLNEKLITANSLDDDSLEAFLPKHWRRVINRLVFMSLLLYLSAVTMIIFMFFYPHWWY